MSADLRSRLEAVERAVTDGETDLTGVEDAAALDARLDAVETTVEDIAGRLDHLDATTQALRGYLGGVDGVSDDVERRADLALAKVETLERSLLDGDGLTVERLDRVPETDTNPSSERSSTTEHTPQNAVTFDDRRSPPSRAEPSHESTVRSDTTPNSSPADVDAEAAERSLVSRLRDVL